MKVEIKKFEELSNKELYEIMKSRAEVFVLEQKITCEEELDNKDYESYHVFAWSGDRIAGYLRIVPKGLTYDEISLGRVITIPSHRGTGLGFLVAKKAVDFIREELKESKIKISSQEYAKGFYRKLGFIEFGEVYSEANIPHIKMINNLR